MTTITSAGGVTVTCHSVTKLILRCTQECHKMSNSTTNMTRFYCLEKVLITVVAACQKKKWCAVCSHALTLSPCLIFNRTRQVSHPWLWWDLSVTAPVTLMISDDVRLGLISLEVYCRCRTVDSHSPCQVSGLRWAPASSLPASLPAWPSADWPAQLLLSSAAGQRTRD